MSLLGEISKNSEALRYHARTAEIAGQNLAHATMKSMPAKSFGQGCHVHCPWRFQTSGLEEAVWIMQGVNFWANE